MNPPYHMEIVDIPGLSGELYLPGARAGKSAAVVILSSSAGVCDGRERFYARFFASRGVAALAADSFGPRGIKNTIEDQSLFRDEEMEKDAYAAFERLRADERIDAGRVAVMGVSKGGLAALNTALAARRRRFGGAERDFAAHISLVPPCHMQQRDARTNGRPILMLLAGGDDYTGTAQPLLYAERMRACGADVTVEVYPEARHAWELPGKAVWLASAENYSRCLFLIEDDGRITDARGGDTLTIAEFFRLRERYRFFGAHAGGGSGEFKLRVASDVLSFLEKRGIFLPAARAFLI
jgi:dienelactone hydrolase